MTIQPTVLNRLVAARHLISNSGQELTHVSDPLAVAQKILVAHDASELVMMAIKSHLDLKPPEMDGRIKVEASFMAIVRSVSERVYPSEPEQRGNAVDLFDHMNRLRVAFKHHGNLPETGSSYDLFARVTALLDHITQELVGVQLQAIDHASAIANESARDHFAKARIAISDGLYKEALENVSIGLVEALQEVGVASDVKPGVVSTEEALLLSGRGIDPASFITMQKLIPRVDHQQNAEWDLRGTGHSQNWNRDNAEFCLKTAITTAVRLQSAPLLPIPDDFYDWFEDVVEITSDQSQTFVVRNSMGSAPHFAPIASFPIGTKLTGKAKGHFEKALDIASIDGFGFEYATYISLERAEVEGKALFEPRLYESSTLWFLADHVTVSYQKTALFKWLEENSSKPDDVWDL